MKRSTLLKALLAGIASLPLVFMPTVVLAQHGGGGHGGGGGGGGFHGGGGSYGGGSHGGGYSGGYRGGEGHSSYGGGGGYGRMGGNSSSARSASAGRPWASEGRGVRDTSPGWHSFARSGNSIGGRNSGEAASREATSHQTIADGQWHGFGGERAATSSNARLVAGSSVAGRNVAFAGRGFYGGYRGFGWGGCWGCGWGFGGWGLGFGWGWNPFWFWPSYWYPWWGSYYYGPYIYPDAY